MDTFNGKKSKRQASDKRFNKLKAMKCFQEMHTNVCGGWPIRELARWIQEEKREYSEITRNSLITILTEYRNALPPVEVLNNEALPIMERASEQLENGLNTLDEMEKLYRIQMARVVMDHKIETAIGKSLKDLGNEMRVARELLVSYEELRMDLGLAKRHLGQIDIDAKMTADISAAYSPQIAEGVDDAQSRQKLLAVSEKMLRLLGSSGAGDLLDRSEVIDVTDVTPVEEENEEELVAETEESDD